MTLNATGPRLPGPMTTRTQVQVRSIFVSAAALLVALFVLIGLMPGSAGAGGPAGSHNERMSGRDGIHCTGDRVPGIRRGDWVCVRVPKKITGTINEIHTSQGLGWDFNMHATASVTLVRKDLNKLQVEYRVPRKGDSAITWEESSSSCDPIDCCYYGTGRASTPVKRSSTSLTYRPRSGKYWFGVWPTTERVVETWFCTNGDSGTSSAETPYWSGYKGKSRSAAAMSDVQISSGSLYPDGTYSNNLNWRFGIPRPH